MLVQIAYTTTLSVRERLHNDIHVCVFEIADHIYSPLSFYLSKSAFTVNNFKFWILKSMFFFFFETYIGTILSIFQVACMICQNIIFISLGYCGSGLAETIDDFLIIFIITMLVSAVVCAIGEILFIAWRGVTV